MLMVYSVLGHDGLTVWRDIARTLAAQHLAAGSAHASRQVALLSLEISPTNP